MLKRDEYPAGVPCWIDVLQPDVEATMAFYGGLFGWEFEVRTPAGAPTAYAYARKDGLLVAGVGGPPEADDQPPAWTTYVRVESVDDTAATVLAAGGQVVAPPVDIPRSGRVAVCTDPAGAVFGLWQPAETAGRRAGQRARERGTSATSPPGAPLRPRSSTARCSAGSAIPSRSARVTRRRSGGCRGTATSWPSATPSSASARRRPRRPAASPTPWPSSTRRRPGTAPAGWNVTFAVADADAAFARALSLGATVVTPLFDTMYTRMGTVADPQGAASDPERVPPAGNHLSRRSRPAAPFLSRSQAACTDPW